MPVSNVPKRNLSASLTLFFVAPLVAEYLLGDLPLNLLSALVILAPAYGGAALLIRETARRAQRGWQTMLLLGAAYTFIAEGLVTQSLFNHDYLKLHLHLLDHAYIPALGIGAWWTFFMLNLHTFWSIGVSVALVEALFPQQAEIPWLGPAGDAIVALICVLGLVADYSVGFMQNHFLASHAQLLCAVGVSVLCILLAFAVPDQNLRCRADIVSNSKAAPLPAPWATGAATFLLGSGILYTPPGRDWGAVDALLVIDAVFLALLTQASRQQAWGPLHTLSLAAAGALAYGFHAFTQKPIIGSVFAMRITNACMLVAAIGLISAAVKRNQPSELNDCTGKYNKMNTLHVKQTE